MKLVIHLMIFGIFMNEDYDKLLEIWRDEKKRRQFSEQELSKEVKLRQEAEGEMSILKTISVHSSPEMRDAKKEINELKKTIDLKNEEIQNLDLQHKKDQDIIHQKTARILSLEQIEEQHHKLNRETMKENKQLRNDNKQLAKQINDQIGRLRKSGL